MVKRSKFLSPHHAEKPATEFYLRHPMRRSKFIHKNALGRTTYATWKEDGIKKRLARLEGTLDSKDFVLYKPDGEEPLKIPLSLSLTGLPSEEPVLFYFGFSYAGPLAYNPTYKDNRETQFHAREILSSYPGYINDMNENSDDSGFTGSQK